MICHRAPIEGWNTQHGVDDVFVKPREEPKSVLAGKAMVDPSLSLRQMGELMSAGAVVMGHLDAAGLASRSISALENLDLKAALDQLVRGTHTRDAAAEDDDAGRHA